MTSLAKKSPTADPWDKNKVSIHLAKSRLALLRHYAGLASSEMSPADAIYSLIDRSADLLALNGTKNDPSNDPLKDIARRLAALEKQSEANAGIGMKITEALDNVSDALRPIHCLMETISRSNDELESGRPGTSNVGHELPSSAWISHAISRTQAQGKNQLVFRLGWRHAQINADQTMSLTFSAEPAASGNLAEAPGELSLLLIGALPLDLQFLQLFTSTPASDFLLVCSRSGGSRWQGTVVSNGSQSERQRLLSFDF